MQFTIHKAKTQLSKLIAAAEAGEEVIISRGNKPVVRLEPVKEGGFKFGILEGTVPPPGPDFFEPMSEEELRLWEGGN